MTRLILSLLSAITLLLSAPLRADHDHAPAREPFALTTYIENDGGYVKPDGNTDRHYTSGVELSLAHQPAWARQVGDWLQDVTWLGWLNQPFAQRRTAAGYSFGQQIFTPDRIERHRLQRDERPYAGWLYGSVFWQRDNDPQAQQTGVLDQVELTLGIVGPSALGEDAQNWIHRDITNDPEARGWRHQLRDEPGFNASYLRKWRLDVWRAAGHDVNAQLIPQMGFTLGTVNRHALAGATLRLGLLPDDFGPGRIEEPAAATGLRNRRNFALYGYVRIAGRVVEHNVLLEGNNWKSSHDVRPEPLVGEIQGGIVLQVNRCLELSYSLTYLTHEFKGQDQDDAYGLIAAKFVYPF